MGYGEKCMKAAVYYGVNDVRIQKMPEPEIKKDEVLIRVRACGVCASDFRNVKIRKSFYIKPPIILGHEIAGEIVKVGDEVNEFKEGERVVIAPGIGCGKCMYCLTGKDNLCKKRITIGANINGGFAEYIKLPKTYFRGIIPFTKDLTFEEAALTEPLSTCLHGMLRAGVKIEDIVVILGAGPIGLLHIQLAKILGAGRIIVCEAVEERIKMAQNLGAETVNIKEEEPIKKIEELTYREKADEVIIAVGSTEAINQGLKMVKDGGTVIIFGGVPEGATIQIDPNIIHYSEINVTGSYDATLVEFKKALKLISHKKVNTGMLISHILPLDRIMDAFNLMERRECIKVVVTP